MKKIVKFYLKPYYGRMVLGVTIKFTGTIMDLLLPWALAHMIDVVIPSNDRRGIFFWGGFMIVCSVLAVSFNIIANRMAARVSSDAIFTIREDLFAKVMYLPYDRGDKITRPSLISRLTSDTYNVHQMLTRIQRLGVRAPILMIGGVLMTMVLDPVLACVLLATMPVLAVIVIMVSKKSIPMFSALQTSVDRFVRLVREDIAGIRVIKALSKEDYERRRFDAINREVVAAEKKATMTTAMSNPALNIILNLGMVGVIIVGAYRVNAGTSEVGKILAFMTYFTIILNAMMSISKMFTVLSKAMASAERIDQILEEADERQPVCGGTDGTAGNAESQASDGTAGNAEGQASDGTAGNAEGQAADRAAGNAEGQAADRAVSSAAGGGSDGMAPKKSVPHVEFDHVSFSYNKKHDNVSDINFRLMRGETLGIIGSTGSGKTTIVNLLMRFYDADSGSIRIDGQDIRSMDYQELRKRFGAVFQNDVIFENNIFENINMGRGISMNQADQAVQYARAAEFVAEKGGLGEQLDIKGANLSGGQKQRILIARALAAAPEILVLDDSSSALDYKTDAALRQELRSHFQNTTCVIVAQRVSSVMSADHIMVLEEGNVIGYGTHQYLMETCPVYREIGSSQMGE